MIERSFHDRLVLGALALLFLLGGCAGTPIVDSLNRGLPDGMPRQMELTDVPFHSQTEYHCGPAALATAMGAIGVTRSPDQLAGQVFTPGRQGSLQTDMITATRRQGLLPLRVKGMSTALEDISHGHPVLILQNLGLEMAPQWHYAVLVGYDMDRGEAILRSGTVARLSLPLPTLEHTWRRSDFWGLIVSPPAGPPPDGVDLGTWMAEAAGVERAGQTDAAIAAYRTALSHWPDKAAPWIALANLRFAEGNADAAEANLNEALKRDPDHQAAHNNLAHILLQRGALTKARSHALKAVESDGAHTDAARQTLQEIDTALARSRIQSSVND